MKLMGRARTLAKVLVTRTLEFEFEAMPYRLYNVPTGKILALIRAQYDHIHPRPGRPWYPTKLQIETSSACSLHCPLCPAGTGAADSPHRNMAFPVFRDIIDETCGHAFIAVMWVWGEPMLNPKVFDMIAYAHSRNLATVVSTNGQHLQTMEDAERLVASGLDNLIIALDGATQETYSQYRVGGDIRRILNCLELVCRAKKSLGSATPGVNVRTVVMKHNEHELPEIEAIARRHGADMVSRKTACLPDFCGDGTDESFAPADPRYRRFEYKDGKRLRMSGKQFHCRRPWDRLTVCSDGTVLSCEFDYDRATPFGKGGNGNSFLKAWWSDEAAEFRCQFNRDRNAYRFCAECHFRDRKDNVCTAEMKFLSHAA